MISAKFILLVVGAVATFAGFGPAARAEDQSQIQEVSGIAFGGDTMMVYVARDKAAWDNVKKAVGASRMPPDRQKEPGLAPLDHVDFSKNMIVAVFWGKMNFSGHGENCWIQGVTQGKKEVTVDCQAILWGGDILRSYTAYPYHLKAVPRSELPVTFVQTVQYKADAARSEKEKQLATLGPNEWKQEIANKSEN